LYREYQGALDASDDDDESDDDVGDMEDDDLDGSRHGSHVEQVRLLVECCHLVAFLVSEAVG
jgi:hypothetical protein